MQRPRLLTEQLKYFSLFSGIGGFELGIHNASQTKRIQQGEPNQNLSNPQRPQLSSKSLCTGIQNIRPIQSESGKRPAKFNCSPNQLQQWECVGFSEIDKYATQIYKTHFNHKEYGDVSTINWSDTENFDLLVGGFPCQAFSIAGKRQGFNDTRGTLFFEIARCLKEKHPRLLLLENVKGLLSHDKGRTFGVILNTLDELGYDLQWQVLNSKNFGVPQNRERVFIVGHLRGTSRPQVFPLGQANEIHPENNDQRIAKCLDSNYHKGWLDHGQRTMIAYGTSQDQKLSQNISQSLNADHYNQPKIGVINGKLDDGTLESKAGFQENGNMSSMPRKEENGISSQKRELAQPSTREHSRDMSQLPQQNTSSQRKMQDLQQTDERSGLLRETLSEIQEIRQSQDVQKKPAYSDYRIRRLTPLEAERLQGFPDGWTEGISDTQRYKCLGNAVTVNVIEAIMVRIV